MLHQLQALNPDLNILPVTDPSFARYGRVLPNFNTPKAVEIARKKWVLADSVGANASEPDLEQDVEFKQLASAQVYGEMPIEIGWVYGKNSLLNGLEYHQGSEVHFPLEDVIFLVAHFEEIEWTPDARLDTHKIRAYYAPQGTVTELYTWCLHYVPVHVYESRGFCDVFTLPQGTGSALQQAAANTPDGRLLIARNQWLIAHPDASDLAAAGMHLGLYGPNTKVNPIP